MKMNETVAGLTITAKTEGVDQAKKQVEGLTQATEQLGTVSETTSKRVISLEDAWKRQTLRLDEAARAQANIARETKLADAALREGVATQAQHAQRLEQINQRYTTAATATKEFGNQTGLARHELINLGRQAQDVGVSLVSGQSPLMILAQQGSQIADVFIASGKSVGSFFSQAIAWARPFVTSTAGIVTGIAAIGAAAVYAASQFLKASTTIEQALENENRLLKEGKALVDARTSAEARAQLNPKDLTEYELKRNLLDVQRKLNEEARAATIRSVAPKPGLLDIIRGESSAEVLPQTPGMDKMIDATLKLKAAQAAGLPGLKEFNAELGRIATAHPELAKTVDKMIELGRTGIELENAEMRLKAISDALKGIATDAQLAAVGLGSVAQFKLSNLQADQAKEATELQAKAVLQMAEAYPGMSIEVAKQLDALKGQLQIVQARTGLEAINAQYYVTQNQLLLQGKTLEEAMAVAAAQRAVSLAQVNAQADRQLKTLQEEYELIRASSEEEKSRIKARQEYERLIKEGVDPQRAGQIAAQMQANARATEDAADATESWSVQMDNANDAINRVGNSIGNAADNMAQLVAESNRLRAALSFVPTITLGDALGPGTSALFQSKQGGYSQFNPQGYTSPTTGAGILGAINASDLARMTEAYGEGGFDPKTLSPNAQGMMKIFEQQFNTALTQSGGNLSGAVGGMIARGGVFTGSETDPQRLALLERAINLMSPEQQIGSYQGLMGQLQAAPQNLQTAEMTKQLGDKLAELTRATDENTDATHGMTDVLSPYYSSDPRRTHLGFRAFAGGGIMTQYGELPLKQYAGGGMATSPQVAIFGEGSTPEAYVPAPAGRIPVEIKGAANSNQRPVNVTINVMGNADAGTVAALKQTSFQKAQQLRKMTG